MEATRKHPIHNHQLALATELTQWPQATEGELNLDNIYPIQFQSISFPKNKRNIIMMIHKKTLFYLKQFFPLFYNQ
jgi:hypothetical protein